MSSFDKNAQMLRAVQMSGSGYVQPPQLKVPQVFGFDSAVLRVGDVVAHPTCSSNSVSLSKRTITEIDEAGQRVRLDRSPGWVTRIDRLVKMHTA